jgi:TetR/AcrR family transcriptional regulator
MDIQQEYSNEQTILRVAEELFLKNGFSATSTTEIAKEVGCNQALIHYYFRTKENLFNSIFEQKFKNFFQDIFITNDHAPLSFTEKLKQLIEAHFDLISENPKLPLLIINELSRKKEHVNSMREKLQHIPEKLLSELNSGLEVEIAAGRIRKMELKDLMISILSLNISLFLLMPIVEEVLALKGEEKIKLIAYRRKEHVDLILNNLKPQN